MVIYNTQLCVEYGGGFVKGDKMWMLPCAFLSFPSEKLGEFERLILFLQAYFMWKPDSLCGKGTATKCVVKPAMDLKP